MHKLDPIERLLDGVCPQYISRSLICRWFRRAVLPQQPKLEQAILSPKKLRRCAVCGRGYLARSGRTKYCPTCAKNIHRQQKAKSDNGNLKVSSLLRKESPCATIIKCIGASAHSEKEGSEWVKVYEAKNVVRVSARERMVYITHGS